MNVTGHVTNDLDLLVTVGLSWDYHQYSVADTIEITLAEDDDSSVNCITPLYTFKLPFGEFRLLFCVRYSGRQTKVGLCRSVNFRKVFRLMLDHEGYSKMSFKYLLGTDDCNNNNFLLHVYYIIIILKEA